MLDPKNPQFRYLRDEDPCDQMHDPKNPQLKNLKDEDAYG
jgi:hypothetical protein